MDTDGMGFGSALSWLLDSDFSIRVHPCPSVVKNVHPWLIPVDNA